MSGFSGRSSDSSEEGNAVSRNQNLPPAPTGSLPLTPPEIDRQRRYAKTLGSTNFYSENEIDVEKQFKQSPAQPEVTKVFGYPKNADKLDLSSAPTGPLPLTPHEIDRQRRYAKTLQPTEIVGEQPKSPLEVALEAARNGIQEAFSSSTLSSEEAKTSSNYFILKAMDSIVGGLARELEIHKLSAGIGQDAQKIKTGQNAHGIDLATAAQKQSEDNLTNAMDNFRKVIILSTKENNSSVMSAWNATQAAMKLCFTLSKNTQIGSAELSGNQLPKPITDTLQYMKNTAPKRMRS